MPSLTDGAAARGVEPELALAGEDIVCLAHEPWHGPWKTYQQVMSLLARWNRVLYVGPPASLRAALGGRRRRADRPPVLERVTEGLTVYHEPPLLARASEGRAWGPAFNRVANALRLAHAARLAGQERMRAPILWIFDPSLGGAVGRFGEKLVVYHVLDNYVEFFPPAAARARAAMARAEAVLLARADIVFAVSERLYRRCAAANPYTMLVPNGVDYERFQAARREGEGRIPPDIAGIPRPRLGYVGVLQADLDFRLLGTLAAERPAWSLVFVGPDELAGARPHFQALLRRPNVRYLGSRMPADVPGYINACDVCVMPVDPAGPGVADSDSIKVYEYLACGKAVVATDIPSLRRFEPLVRVVRDAAGFLRGVEDALAEGPDASAERAAAAKAHSWRGRVDLIATAIRRRVPAQAPPDGDGGGGRRR